MKRNDTDRKDSVAAPFIFRVRPSFLAALFSLRTESMRYRRSDKISGWASLNKFRLACPGVEFQIRRRPPADLQNLRSVIDDYAWRRVLLDGNTIRLELHVLSDVAAELGSLRTARTSGRVRLIGN